MRKFARALSARLALLVIYSGCYIAYGLFGLMGRLVGRRRERDAQSNGPYDLLLIGTFYTRNWCIAHLRPLSMAGNVRRVIAVVDGPTEPLPKVVYATPPRWMVRVMGRALAKFYCALRIALRDRPHLVMGYHLLPGAITALLVARATGARSGYQVTGGPVELIGGGAATENFLLRNLVTDSILIERLACLLVRRFELIVVRGSGAKDFMLKRGLGRHVCVVPGSIDTDRFAANGGERNYDVVSVGRLVPIKRPDRIVRTLEALAARRPGLRAVIVGDGPMMDALRRQIEESGLSKNVELAGHIEKVETVLRRSKCFLLTSRSEGLSIAMAEAMAAGVVPVVTDVGDLCDLVHDGVTGRLVPADRIDEHASRLAEILEDDQRREEYSRAAREAAVRHNGVQTVSARWESTIEDVCAADRRAEPTRARSVARLSRYNLWRAFPRSAKRALHPIVRHLPCAWLLGSRFRRMSRFVEQAQWWSAERAREYQLHELRKILHLAYDRTQYYRRAFDAIGFDPRDLRSVEQMNKLPTTNSETIRGALEDMCTVSGRRTGIDTVSTGGTGGKPLRFYIGSDRSAVEYAYLVSGWGRAGYSLDMVTATFRGEVIRQDRAGLRHNYDPLLRRHEYSTFHMGEEQMRQCLEHVAGIGPCYLHVYPSTVSMLAAFMRRTGVSMPANIKGILAGSENVYAQQRTLVKEMFPVPFLSWYGQSEKLVLGVECAHSSHYHIWPTYGYFELLDENDQPISTPGVRGEIVGTGFINQVVPFIRYRTGDYGTYVSDRCDACGRHHPVIADVRGHRTQEVLVAADRSLISWTALNMHDETFDRVRQFQFAQSVPGKAVLRIVPGQGFDPSDTARIHSRLGAKMDGNLEFEVEICERITLTPGGKSIYVDQKIEGIESYADDDAVRPYVAEAAV